MPLIPSSFLRLCILGSLASSDIGKVRPQKKRKKIAAEMTGFLSRTERH
jgi:hypothetical protein